MIISASEFKAKCLELLDRVHKSGEELIISKRGKPVARLIAEHADKPWLALRGKGRFVGDPYEPVTEEPDIEALK